MLHAIGRAWVIAVLASVLTIGAAVASPPLDENCTVLSTGSYISDQLTREMRSTLDEQARDVMGIFDMSCLSNIIKFGGLNWFGLDGWLDSLQGALCNRVRDWIEGNAALWDEGRHPSPFRVAVHRDAIRAEGDGSC